MSLCIAATCRLEGEPSAVFCCDLAGTRGDVKSEDIIKIVEVGDSEVLLAGNMGRARELLATCKPYIEAFPFCGDEVEITRLKLGIVDAVRLQKRAIATGVLSAELGVTYDEVFNFSQSNPDNPLWENAR